MSALYYYLRKRGAKYEIGVVKYNQVFLQQSQQLKNMEHKVFNKMV